jgi:hypothetical protein
MPYALRLLIPLRSLLVRALVIHAGLRLLVAGVGAAAERSGGGSPDSPFGIVVLVTLLGAIDLRRRGEAMLWADLGYSPVVTAGVFGAVAFTGELLLAFVRA